MTSEAQRAAIKKMIEQHTKAVTTSKQAARDSLVREGVYTHNGELAPSYGGPGCRDCKPEKKFA
jgi:hypothetical protein